MRSIIKASLLAAALACFVSLLPASSVMAQADIIQGAVNEVGGKGATPLMEVVENIIKVFLYIIGTLSVVMVIYGGFKYVTSSGESSAVASAKNTILYAVIGIVVSILAYAIVDFTIDIFEPTPDNPSVCVDSGDTLCETE